MGFLPVSNGGEVYCLISAGEWLGMAKRRFVGSFPSPSATIELMVRMASPPILNYATPSPRGLSFAQVTGALLLTGLAALAIAIFGPLEIPNSVRALLGMAAVFSALTVSAYAYFHRRGRSRSTIRIIFEFALTECILGFLCAVPWLFPAQVYAGSRRPSWPEVELANSLEFFKRDCGRYPTSQEGVIALVLPPRNARGWKGPYTNDTLYDSRGARFAYSCPGTNNPQGYDLVWVGPDGQLGTADDHPFPPMPPPPTQVSP
jgi:hypothetical protein